MLRKLALVIVTVFFSHSAPNAGVYVLCIMLGVMFVSFAVHEKFNPYKEPILDRLEKLSMGACIFELWIGIFFYIGTPLVVEIILTVALLLINAAMLGAFALSIVEEMIRMQILKRLPLGSTRTTVNGALTDQVIYHGWGMAKHMPDGLRKRVVEGLVLYFVFYMEKGARTIEAIREDVPRSQHAMRDAAIIAEIARRSDAVASWVSAGLVRDEKIAAWVAWYEGAGRSGADLSSIVTRTLLREKDGVSVLQKVPVPLSLGMLSLRLVGVKPLEPPPEHTGTTKRIDNRDDAASVDVELPPPASV